MSKIGFWLQKIGFWLQKILVTKAVSPKQEAEPAIVHDSVIIKPKPAQQDSNVAVPTVALLRSLGWKKPDVWSAVLAKACAARGITTRLQLAAFLANISHETNKGQRLVESFDYTPERLKAVFGSRATAEVQSMGRRGDIPADQRGLANALYGGTWGKKNLGNIMPDDGWRFRGRGLIQLTGRDNYSRFASVIGADLDDAFLARLETPVGAAESAAHFWVLTGCNDPAQRGDITRVRRIVNAGSVGLLEVQECYEDVLEKI